jgi:Zn finger protein HypA/HybF involved in hydrogenase expression
MHESSLASDWVRQVDQLAREHGAERVLTVRLRIGEFSGVEADLLASAYARLVTILHFASRN